MLRRSPRKIRCRAPPVDHRAGHADARCVQRDPWAFVEKLSDRVSEGLEFVARQNPFSDERQRAAPLLEERQRRLRSADVAREDHPVGCSTWPPNFCRMAESTFSAKVWSWRERKRA